MLPRFSMRWSAGVASATLALLMALAPPARAQNVLESGSLQVVPADAAFYSSTLRLGEQIEILRNTKLYVALKNDPFIQAGVAQLQNLLNQDENVREFLEVLKQPENQQLLELLKQASAEEMFVYGDGQFAEQLAFMNSLSGLMRTAQLEAAQSGQNPNEVIPQKLLNALIEHADTIAVPVTVFGFKIKDRQPALDQMSRLETLLDTVLADQPELRARLERKMIGRDEHLVWNLDGSLVPWDELPREDFEGDPEQLDKLIEKLKRVTLTITVGVHEDYLILSFGKDESHLGRLGKGEHLASAKELAPLRKYADKRLTGVVFVRGEFLQRIANIEGQLAQVRDLVAGAVPLADLGDELEAKITTLVNDLSQEITEAVPQPGSLLTLAYLTPRGYEQFSYDSTKYPMRDATKRLTILDHVGGTPILWIAGRSKSNPESLEQAGKWFHRVFDVANEVALAKLDPNERPVYEELRDKLLPLAERFGEITRTKFVPALEDGQSAFVFDARLKSAQLHPAMPASSVPLPVPEIAIVHSVSDRDLLKEAATEYADVVQQALDAVAEVAPDEAPALKLPAPEKSEIAGAEVFAYPLPPALQIDDKLKPNAALSEETLVLSLAPETSGRLLTATPLATEGVLAKTQQPLAAATSFQFAGLIDAIIPWLNYGIVQAQGEDTAPAIMGIARNYLNMLKCFRGVNSVVYLEDGVWVTQSEVLLSDLE